MRFWTEALTIWLTEKMKKHLKDNGGANYHRLLILLDMAEKGALDDAERQALAEVMQKLEAKKE